MLIIYDARSEFHFIMTLNNLPFEANYFFKAFLFELRPNVFSLVIKLFENGCLESEKERNESYEFEY